MERDRLTWKDLLLGGLFLACIYLAVLVISLLGGTS